MLNAFQQLAKQLGNAFSSISNSSNSQSQLSITPNTEQDLDSHLRGNDRSSCHPRESEDLDSKVVDSRLSENDSVEAENNSDIYDNILQIFPPEIWVMILQYSSSSVRILVEFSKVSVEAGVIAQNGALAIGFFRNLSATIPQFSHKPSTLLLPNLMLLLEDFENTQKPEEKQRLMPIIDKLLTEKHTQEIILKLFSEKENKRSLYWQEKLKDPLKYFLHERILMLPKQAINLEDCQSGLELITEDEEFPILPSRDDFEKLLKSSIIGFNAQIHPPYVLARRRNAAYLKGEESEVTEEGVQRDQQYYDFLCGFKDLLYPPEKCQNLPESPHSLTHS